MAELELATTTQAEELAGRLSALNLTIVYVGKTMPVVFLKGTRGQLLALRDLPGISMILSAAPMIGESYGGCDSGGTKPNCDVDSNIWTGIDAYFNANGYYGGNQRVGILEVTEDDCKLDSTHEAFAYASFNYQNAMPASCINRLLKKGA